MRHRTVLGALALALLVAVVLAGCGSSGRSSSSSSEPTTGGSTESSETTSSTKPAAEPQGAPIKLGSVDTCGGALASGLGGDCPTIEAWAKWVNSKGGINGHPVELTVVDDEADPTKALSGLKELIEGDHVMALVGSYSVVDPTWEAYVEKSGVPVVGGGASETPFTTSADFFPSGATVLTEAYGLAEAAKKAGKSKIALPYCAEAPICKSNAESTKAVAENLIAGVEVPYIGAISATEPTYTAACLAMKSSGAEAAYYALSPDVAVRLAEQCTQQGFEPLQVSENGAMNGEVAAAPSIEGAPVIVSNVPLSDESLPVTKEFHEALTEFAPDLTSSDPQWNSSLTNVWSGGLLFEAAAEAGNLGPESTPEEVKNALYTLKNETLGGFAPPLTFTAGKKFHPNCYFTEGVENGELVPLNNSKPSCVPQDKMAELYENPKI